MHNDFNRRNIIDVIYLVCTPCLSPTLDLRVTAYARAGAYALFRGTKVTKSSVHKKWFEKKINFWEIRTKFAMQRML